MLKRICPTFLLCTLLLCLTHAPALAQNTQGTGPALERWMQTYYQNPRPDLVIPMVREGAQREVYEDKTAALPISLFFSHILRAQPQNAAEWCQALAEDPIDTRSMMGRAFYLAQTPQWEKCLRQTLGAPEDYIASLKKTGRYAPLTAPVNSAQALDILWASFYATGDPRYVNKVIGTLTLPQPKEGNANSPEEENTMRILGAARSSLRDNAMEHPTVRAIVQERHDKAQRTFKKELQNILQERDL